MMITSIRTRFAPSPTGLIHLGNLRSALYPWAFARKLQGTFILRIEDTDIERSTDTAAQAILDSLAWLGLDINEGPFYQTDRMARYQQVIQQLLESGFAYPCYLLSAELDALRAAQRARGEKPRYDRRWRPEPGKNLPTPPKDVKPVIRFKNPLTESVVWEDVIKGRIEIANETLDDLVLARGDGSPTYNFCAVVDDIDMRITHVIRGDDHVNNTPRQINLLRALGQTPPIYAHLPTVLDEKGEKMSKRSGAMSVMQYREEGYLPEAILNYLARLGWSHGDDEIFSREQFIAWFDLEHLHKSPAQYNPDKLKWFNRQYIKQTDPARLAQLTQPFLMAKLAAFGVNTIQQPPLIKVVALLKDRASTLKEIAEQATIFYREPQLEPVTLTPYLTKITHAALIELTAAFHSIQWKRTEIQAAFKACLHAYGLKLPQLAMPVRLLVTGTSHTPSIDAVLELFEREIVLERMQRLSHLAPTDHLDCLL